MAEIFKKWSRQYPSCDTVEEISRITFYQNDAKRVNWIIVSVFDRSSTSNLKNQIFFISPRTVGLRKLIGDDRFI